MSVRFSPASRRLMASARWNGHSFAGRLHMDACRLRHMDACRLREGCASTPGSTVVRVLTTPAQRPVALEHEQNGLKLTRQNAHLRRRGAHEVALPK
jgi:hypothetical protein